jgi:hypothetical protein
MEFDSLPRSRLWYGCRICLHTRRVVCLVSVLKFLLLPKIHILLV